MDDCPQIPTERNTYQNPKIFQELSVKPQKRQLSLSKTFLNPNVLMPILKFNTGLSNKSESPSDISKITTSGTQRNLDLTNSKEKLPLYDQTALLIFLPGICRLYGISAKTKQPHNNTTVS